MQPHLQQIKHTKRSVKNQIALYFIIIFCSPRLVWFLSPLHGLLKKGTLQNKSWKRTTLVSEQIKRKYNHCFTALSVCQDCRQALELFSHIVCLHQVQFKNWNNCLQLTPVSFEGNKVVCSLRHINTHINMGGADLFWGHFFRHKTR